MKTLDQTDVATMTASQLDEIDRLTGNALDDCGDDREYMRRLLARRRAVRNEMERRHVGLTGVN